MYYKSLISKKSFWFLLFFISLSTVFSQGNDLTLIKNRIYLNLINKKINFNNLEKVIKEFDGEKWPNIKYEDVSREGFDNRIHTSNMVELAIAFKNQKSKYHNKKRLKEILDKTLGFWCSNDFIGDNWWNNQIGTPTDLAHLMLLMENEFSEKLVKKSQEIISRANINRGGARPGGDRIKVSSIAAKNQLFLNNNLEFDKIIDIIENEIKFVEWTGSEYGYTYSKNNVGGLNEFSRANGRGLQYDNSFHHRTDGVNNTLSYGLSYSLAFIEWGYFTRKTKYAFSEEKINIIIDYYLDGVCKTAVYGKFPDFAAKNRSVSRKGSVKPYTTDAVERLLQISNYRSKELKEIMDLRNNTIQKPTVSHATFYWNSEHFSFQRPNFFSSVRMYSSRNMNMESPYNSEGILNHHRGDGANHIVTKGDEYYDISPVYDYMKIPGATIVQKEKLPNHNTIKKIGTMDFVGAVTDGKYGVVGFDFKSPHDPLVARKSWFFFEEEYVCLGAGISTKMKNEVNTTLNQSLLRGEVVVSAEGKIKTLKSGEQTLSDIDWIHHDNITYLFPKHQTIFIKNDIAKGSWWRISKQISSSKDTVELAVFKTWINHGESPSDASYEYIVKPGALNKIDKQKTFNNIQILSNTPYLQAVKNTNLGIIQMVFYKAGEIKISKALKFKCHAPGIVMLKMNKNTIKEVSVSDPNRELTQISFSINHKINTEGKGFKTLWNEENSLSTFLVALPEGSFQGSTVKIKL